MDINDILQSELFKIILKTKIDTGWKMLALQDKGVFPDPFDEGATGFFDNKGAIFVPGGIIATDKERTPFNLENFENLIIDAMKYDNATLIYPDGIIKGQKIDSLFFSANATNFLDNLKIQSEARHLHSKDPPYRFTEEDISISYCPKYMINSDNPSFGSRTELSAGLASCLTETKRLYYILDNEITRSKSMSKRNKEFARKDLVESILSVRHDINFNNTLITPPYIFVSHTTRYKKDNLVGLTRILGYGEFGEMSTFTIEPNSKELLKKAETNTSKPLIKYKDQEYLGVLRVYPKTNPGKRNATNIQMHIIPINIDLEKITKESKQRYSIS